MDFNALQHKLFELDPSDPAEDLRKLTESAGGQAQGNVAETVNYVQESVEVKEGTMPIEGDYSLGDFAALAGVQLDEDWKQSARRGWDNYSSPKAVGLENPLADFGKPGSKEKSTKKSAKSPVIKPGQEWKSFLSQHTSMLQKISRDPRKRKQFDSFMSKMSEGTNEERTDEIYPAIAGIAARAAAGAVADKVVDKLNANKNPKKTPIKNRNPVASHAQSSGSGVHKDQFKKNLPDRKQKHKKDYATESIKEMLYRKLNEKK